MSKILGNFHYALAIAVLLLVAAMFGLHQEAIGVEGYWAQWLRFLHILVDKPRPSTISSDGAPHGVSIARLCRSSRPSISYRPDPPMIPIVHSPMVFP